MSSGHILSIPDGIISQVGFSSEFAAKFVLFIAILLFGTIVIGKILKILLRVPTIAGQIVGGILLGPSLLNIRELPIFLEPLEFVDYATGNIYALMSSDLFIFFVILISATFTTGYLMWIAGHETDIKDILKVGLSATVAGILGAIVPIVMIVAWFKFTGSYLSFSACCNSAQSVAIGLIFSATSVSIPVAMLFSYNKMHLRSSKATLGAAIIDDIFAVILLSIYMILLQSGFFGVIQGLGKLPHSASLVAAVGYMLVSFVAFGIIGYFIIPPVIFWLRRARYVHLITPLANVFMFSYFAFAELIGGLAGITGAYFAGIFHRMGDSKHYAEKTISPYVNSVLLPLFLGSIGLQINLNLLGAKEVTLVLILSIIAVISKFLGTYIAIGLSNLFDKTKKGRWTVLEGYLFGSAMIARGEVGLVIATLLKSANILGPQLYVVSVVVIVITTIVSPVLLALGFAWQVKSSQLKKGKIKGDYIVSLGSFPVVGTKQIFSIIIGVIESHGQFNTSISLSEGRKVVNLEGINVKMIYCPRQGVTFEGDRTKIREILKIVEKEIFSDVKTLQKPVFEEQ